MQDSTKVKNNLLIFGANNHPISHLVRRESWSDFSHVGIIDGEYVLESRGPEVLPLFLIAIRVIPNDIKYGGVVRTPIDEFKARYNKIEIRETIIDMEGARACVGVNKFDIDGLIGGWFRYNIHNEDDFFCTEYVAMFVDNFLDKKMAYKSTPNILRMVSKLV